jgi:hypothetical protein
MSNDSQLDEVQKEVTDDEVQKEVIDDVQKEVTDDEKQKEMTDDEEEDGIYIIWDYSDKMFIFPKEEFEYHFEISGDYASFYQAGPHKTRWDSFICNHWLNHPKSRYGTGPFNDKLLGIYLFKGNIGSPNKE